MSNAKKQLITFVPVKNSITVSTNDGTYINDSLIQDVIYTEISNGNIYYTDSKTLTVTTGTKYYLSAKLINPGATSTLTVTEND